MWLNERARQTGGAGYECAGVTLGGSQVETVASAHLRETPVYAPYGYAANVPAGAQVLLLSGGEDGAVVAGARMGSTDLAPGEVELRGPGGGDRTGRHGVFCGRAALFAVCHHQGSYHSCRGTGGGCAGRFSGQDHCP